MRFVAFALILVTTLTLFGCSSKKVVVRNCEKAGNAELFVCDPL